MAFEINPNVVITGGMNSDLFNTQNNKLSKIMTLLNFHKQATDKYVTPLVHDILR
jgi:hypothetical protein